METKRPSRHTRDDVVGAVAWPVSALAPSVPRRLCLRIWRALGHGTVFRFPRELWGLALRISDVEAQSECLQTHLSRQAHRGLDATAARKRLMLIEQTLAQLHAARGEMVRRTWIGGERPADARCTAAEPAAKTCTSTNRLSSSAAVVCDRSDHHSLAWGPPQPFRTPSITSASSAFVRPSSRPGSATQWPEWLYSHSHAARPASPKG